MIWLWLTLTACVSFVFGFVLAAMLSNAKHADEVMRLLMELEGD
jgi:ABC-type phosphate/phosphonate transport system permease subunit